MRKYRYITIHVYISLSIYICMYMYLSLSIYVCIYIYTHYATLHYIIIYYDMLQHISGAPVCPRRRSPPCGTWQTLAAAAGSIV